jgi:hypothetical protein
VVRACPSRVNRCEFLLGLYEVNAPSGISSVKIVVFLRRLI